MSADDWPPSAMVGSGASHRLIPAQYVKPFLKGHKNDYRDAEAIAEAVQRPTMRFVPLKSGEQLELQAPHRVRSRPAGRPAHGGDQPDPRLPTRARDRRAPGRRPAAAGAAHDSGAAGGRAPPRGGGPARGAD